MSSFGISGVGSTSYLPRYTGPSDETKQIFKLGSEIKSINRATDYIQEHGEKPPSMKFDYSSLLDAY